MAKQMSANVEANKQEYLTLMKRFVNSEIDGKTFQITFLGMWRQDRDESYSKAESWPRRYDIDLMETRLRGEMTGEEFSKRWRDLWDMSRLVGLKFGIVYFEMLIVLNRTNRLMKRRNKIPIHKLPHITSRKKNSEIS